MVLALLWEKGMMVSYCSVLIHGENPLPTMNAHNIYVKTKNNKWVNNVLICESTSDWVSAWMNESMSQSVCDSMSWSLNHSVDRYLKESTSESTSDSVSHWEGKWVIESISESICHSTSWSLSNLQCEWKNQWVIQNVIHIVIEWMSQLWVNIWFIELFKSVIERVSEWSMVALC